MTTSVTILLVQYLSLELHWNVHRQGHPLVHHRSVLIWCVCSCTCACVCMCVLYKSIISETVLRKPATCPSLWLLWTNTHTHTNKHTCTHIHAMVIIVHALMTITITYTHAASSKNKHARWERIFPKCTD